jgi:hypothetical protein
MKIPTPDEIRALRAAGREKRVNAFLARLAQYMKTDANAALGVVFVDHFDADDCEAIKLAIEACGWSVEFDGGSTPKVTLRAKPGRS